MDIHGMNKCLSKFYLSARKQDGSHYKKTSLLSIRAALDRYLRSPPLNKKFSICDGIQFNEANKAVSSYLKHLASTGKLPGQSTRILWRLKLSKSCLRAENWGVKIRKYLGLCCRQHDFTFRYISVKEVERIKVLWRNPCFAWLLQPQVKSTLS